MEAIVVNWKNNNDKISTFFTVKEALLLPSWGVLHIPSEEEIFNILNQAKKMDMIRGFLGCNVVVHCWYRGLKTNCDNPKYNGMNYNAFVGGAPMSAHTKGMATDWHLKGFESPLGCLEIRKKLLPKLKEFGIGMEDKDGPWIHTDCSEKHVGKFFKP